MFISPPEKSFGQTLTMRLLVLLPVALVLLMIFAVADFDPHKITPVAWAIAAATVGLFALSWWAFSQCLLKFHPEGLAYTNLLGTKEVRWEEIRETYYYKIDQNLYVHFGLIGLLMAAAATRRGNTTSSGQMNLKVAGQDPKQKITISSTLRDCPDAIRLVLAKVNPRLKPEIQRRIQGGETVMFGPVSLSRQGIGFKQKPQVLFSEAKIKFNGAMLAVNKEGKWLSIFKTQAKKIPNVFILLDLIDEMTLGAAARPPDPFVHMAR